MPCSHSGVTALTVRQYNRGYDCDVTRQEVDKLHYPEWQKYSASARRMKKQTLE